MRLVASTLIWLAAVSALLAGPVAELTFGGAEHESAVALLGVAVFFTVVAGGQGALLQGLRRIGDMARLSVMGAFAEFERALIRERQREGIALAKQRGAYRGRKKSLPSERIAELRQRVEAGEQKTKLAREFGISRETLYQYLRTNQ